ncbi:S66 peptidase family protein [Haloplasma contractile]|uniref:LD-carboxypeptidase family protein n=1 Tax=Haloplasma contractile SSD-17B TaxID=1033810 RepID=F7PRG4_9MOLU|nr:S66 peptidase family protein [Haloplasma contractile]ERJ11720.1 LD-carboxypeptidase family protein [Haloplasma contractile SSD-17B]
MNHSLLTKGDHVGLISCSDGISLDNEPIINELIDVLKNLGLSVFVAKTLYKRHGSFSGTGEDRADEVMSLFLNDTIKAIFDVSGGDSANQVLPHLDYETIKKNRKPFFGLSDLSVLLNAIYHRSSIPTYHYQIRNLVKDKRDSQVEYFTNTFFKGGETKYKLEWIRGNILKGTVVGGNLRCFLKLVGTNYCPDFKGKVLFLESLGGRDNRIASYLEQLKQIGALNQISGILLGTFSQMEGESIKPTVDELVLNATRDLDIPIVKTRDLGHGTDAKCIEIGGKINIFKNKNNVL